MNYPKFKKLVIEHGTTKLHELLSYNDFEDIKEDLENRLFNEDYFVVGYNRASQILKDCEIGEFDSIEELEDMQESVFGEKQPIKYNSEWVVNHLAYFYGVQLIEEIMDEYYKIYKIKL